MKVVSIYSALLGQKICAYSRKDAIKRLKARGEL